MNCYYDNLKINFLVWFLSFLQSKSKRFIILQDSVTTASTLESSIATGRTYRQNDVPNIHPVINEEEIEIQFIAPEDGTPAAEALAGELIQTSDLLYMWWLLLFYYCSQCRS